MSTNWDGPGSVLEPAKIGVCSAICAQDSGIVAEDLRTIWSPRAKSGAEAANNFVWFRSSRMLPYGALAFLTSGAPRYRTLLVKAPLPIITENGALWISRSLLKVTLSRT